MRSKMETNKLEIFQAGGWNAASVAAESSKDAALDIIQRLGLAKEYCDKEDWVFLCAMFGGDKALLAAMDN